MLDALRFDILKNLKFSPNYGYDLFLKLHEKHGIKTSSEFYKVLRSLKANGLIKTKESISRNGKTLEILELTKAGSDAYYNQVMEYAKIFIDLLFDLALKKISAEITNQLRIYMKKFENRDKISLYFRGLLISEGNIIRLLEKIFSDFGKSAKVYVQTSDPKRFGSSGVQTHNEYIFFDDTMTFKPETMDVIINIGMDARFLDKGKTSDRIELLNYLKKDGILFMAIGNENKRKGPRMLLDLFMEMTEEFPEEIQDRFFEDLRPLMGGIATISRLSNQELSEVFSRFFSTVQQIDLFGSIDLFILSDKKEQKEI